MGASKRAKKAVSTRQRSAIDPARKARHLGAFGGLIRLKTSKHFTRAGIYIRGREHPGYGVTLHGLEQFATTVFEKDYHELEPLTELPSDERFVTRTEFESYYWEAMAAIGIEKPPDDGRKTLAISALDPDGNLHTRLITLWVPPWVKDTQCDTVPEECYSMVHGPH